MKKYLGEAFGTFALVFCGTGSIILYEQTILNIGNFGIALCFGLTVMALIFILANISGAHINPMVSIGLSLTGHFNKRKIIPYILSQLVGAILASLLLKLIFPLSATLGSTLPAHSAMQAFLIETFLGFILMFAIILLAQKKYNIYFSGIVIGLIIFLEAYFAGPITGASMNPARSIAPVIVSGHLTHLWIYITAPFAGCFLAVITGRIILKNSVKYPVA